ncbi:MAG TPA: 4-hydroxythreonine-4-phosphate dehydrogenase PdxA [Steroidobacteraceae bacterium]|nr:4-hydroxythreonine-4-phosphate dehydrogenase PdxA [Steroidobacteraceae bacterium]
MHAIPRIAITSGEPAGIGPELCLALARADLPCEPVCLADLRLLQSRALAHDSASIELIPYDAARPPAHRTGRLTVLDSPLRVPSEPGRLDVRNAPAVLAMLDRATAGCLAGEFAAMVTAPVQKSCMLDAGIPFVGHTEYLAERTRAPRPVMMLAAGSLRVALATTHLPLTAVSAAITVDSLTEVLAILARDLARWWRLPAPRIAVCGLNPHAGESGHLGDEELRVIAPAIAHANRSGIRAEGPLPADTVFVPQLLERYDAVLAMYHDQGLPVVKHARFDTAVNVTLGLPIVRTSVDHGTALDLAGTGRAQAGSLLAAVRLAAQMVAA